MTTIAYRDGIVVADTQVSEPDWSAARARKIHRVGPYILGGCGDLNEIERFRCWVTEGLKGNPAVSENSETFLILPEGGFLCFMSENRSCKLEADYYAWGSGRRFAIGAMAMGATAAQAVEIAALHDNSTSLPLHTLHVNP